MEGREGRAGGGGRINFVLRQGYSVTFPKYCVYIEMCCVYIRHFSLMFIHVRQTFTS